jgi:orotate phosphoribosyltransferase
MSDILEILKQSGALLTDGHFVYTSGKHGALYINKDIMYIHTDKVSSVGEMFADRAKDLNIEVVAAPALGGIVLSQWTAHHLTKLTGKEVLSVYTEKTPEKNQIFTRGYDAVVKGKRVLVVEDLVTTGGSVRKVVESVKNVGGEVVSVGVMVDRSPDTEPANETSIGAPFFALGRLPVEVYDPDTCPLCEKQIPINTSVGHGKKFLEQNRS